MKKCNKCHEVKDESEFYFRKDNNRFRNDCKVCFNTRDGLQKKAKREYNKTYWQKNKDRETERYRDWYDKTYHTEKQLSRRRRNNYSKYGLTSDQFMELWNKTDGKCYICKRPEVVERSGKVKILAIDHCHSTGIVRGLLCQNCNRALGLLKDDIEVLENAKQYLRDAYGE